MGIFAGLFAYVAAVTAIVICVVIGGPLLLRSEAGPVVPKPPTLPQKILDSIERKRANAVEIRASTGNEAMRVRTTPVSLSPKPTVQVIREISTTAKIREQHRRKVYPYGSTTPTEIVAKRSIDRPMKRNDFPY